MTGFRAALALAVLVLSLPAQELPLEDPCEAVLGRGPQTAWPGIVVDALTGDTLQIQLKHIGLRRVRLAGLQAPRGKEALAPVSRYHLARLAKGLRVFVILDPPWKTWPEEVTAVVDDFTEAQLAAGLARFRPGEEALLGPYGSCRARRAADQAREGGLGIWR